MSDLRLISGGLQPHADRAANSAAPRSEERLPDAEAFDAYSRTVSSVAERLGPSVAHLAISHRTRRGRRDGSGCAVAISSDGYMLT
ncbi:MAG TPA: hypothetical protein VFL56_00800, partial [Solirubrobacterales bacterium]|nr:hypothetical protein [Solirubrobacterales bacterium]